MGAHVLVVGSEVCLEDKHIYTSHCGDDIVKGYVLRGKLKLFSININLIIWHRVLLAENIISVSS